MQACLQVITTVILLEKRGNGIGSEKGQGLSEAGTEEHV